MSKTTVNDDDIFRVPDKLRKPDILIINTKEYFDSGQSFYWRHNHRFPEREDVLDIDTTRSTFNRALRIMDTIIKILRGRGHDIGIKYGKTHVIIYDQEIEIKLREKHRVVDEPKKNSWNSRTLEATGNLSFLIEPNGYYQKVINEGQDKLENKIKSIILKYEEFGAYRREEHIKNQEWHKQWEEKQRIERELKEKKDKEISDFKTIFQRAFRYHQSEILRNYISSVEKLSFEKQDDELNKWVKWAQEKIDWFDHLVNRQDPILNDHDKAEIFAAFFKEWLLKD